MVEDNVSSILEKKKEKAAKKEAEKKEDLYPFNTSMPKELGEIPEEKRNFLYFYSTLNEWGKATQIWSLYKELERISNNCNVIHKKLLEFEKSSQKSPQA